jgi:hypothetical protein
MLQREHCRPKSFKMAKDASAVITLRAKDFQLRVHAHQKVSASEATPELSLR